MSTLLAYFDFDGAYVIRGLLAHVLFVETLDVPRQWTLPEFLLVVGHATQFLRIQAEFPSHLDLGMRQVEAFACLDPRSQILRYEDRFRHLLWLSTAKRITVTVTGAIVVSAATEKCIRVYGLIRHPMHALFAPQLHCSTVLCESLFSDQ